MKRRIALIILVALLVLNSGQALASSRSFPTIIETSLSQGLISVNYDGSNPNRIKLMVEKGTTRYFYDVNGNDSFGLQMGNGTYNIAVLENIEGNRFRVVSRRTVELAISDYKKVFLNSVQNVNWNENMEAIKKAKELTKDAKTDIEKVQAIYNYIVANIKYDYDKLNNLTSDYLPNIDETLKTGKGICYDYSSLMAAMLRSLGIPTKLTTGYTPNAKTYHAWNEVYIQSQNRWVIIDSTYDAEMISRGFRVSMSKDQKDYSTVREF